LRCRSQGSDTSASAVAPHKRGHDERPHRQKQQVHKLADDETLSFHTDGLYDGLYAYLSREVI
jgi:hypothetical protein